MLKAKYYLEWFAYFVIFSLVAIIQATFIPSLPPLYVAINLPLSALLLALLFFDRYTMFVVAAIMGFWLDILGFHIFGLNIVLLSAVAWGADFCLRNWLTNRSLYSFLILSVAGVLAYNLLFQTVIAFWSGSASGLFLGRGYFWQQLFYQMVWSAGFMLLFFNLANSLSKHFKPFFLEKK
jgi:hypothetical protein